MILQQPDAVRVRVNPVPPRILDVIPLLHGQRRGFRVHHRLLLVILICDLDGAPVVQGHEQILQAHVIGTVFRWMSSALHGPFPGNEIFVNHGLNAAQMRDEIGYHILGQPERADMNGAIQYGNPGRTVRFENRYLPVPGIGTTMRGLAVRRTAVRRTAGCKTAVCKTAVCKTAGLILCRPEHPDFLVDIARKPLAAFFPMTVRGDERQGVLMTDFQFLANRR